MGILSLPAAVANDDDVPAAILVCAPVDPVADDNAGGRVGRAPKNSGLSFARAVENSFVPAPAEAESTDEPSDTLEATAAEWNGILVPPERLIPCRITTLFCGSSTHPSLAANLADSHALP